MSQPPIFLTIECPLPGTLLSATTGMVQLNKDERVWVCFEMARVQNAHEVQTLRPNRWPGRRVTTIHVILKKYKKYRKHGTSLNRNKGNSGRTARPHRTFKGCIAMYKEMLFQALKATSHSTIFDIPMGPLHEDQEHRHRFTR